MKDCKKIHPLLSLYAEGDLPAGDAKRVETHLASCADARQELEHLRKLRKTLLALPEPIPPASLHDSIMGRVTGKLRPLRPHRPFFNFPIAGLAVAACLVLYLVVGNPELLKLEHPASVAPAPAAKNETNGLAQNAPAQKDKGVLKEVKREAPASSNYAPQPATAGAVMKEAPAPPAPAAFEIRKTAKKASAPRAKEIAEGYDAGAPPAAQNGVRSFGNTMDNEELKTSAPRAAAPSAQSYLGLPAPTPVPTEGWMADIALSKKFTASAWSGNNSPATVEGGLLITDAAQFEAVWKGLRPSESVPTVDFTTQAVVLLNGGEEPSGGYSVKIRQEEETTDQIIIHYLVLPPAPSLAAGSTHPWTLQVIPKPSLPVQFQKD
jgi:hypothetical protein